MGFQTEEQLRKSKNKKIELVLHQLTSLPTLPAIAVRLLELTIQDDTQANEVVKLIESDPSLASKIISLATNASTGISRNNASLSKAVVLLGFDAVRNAVLSIKVFETLQEANPNDMNVTFDWSGFWKHSMAVACASKRIIKLLNPKVDPEEAFICGLLHDIGKLALVSSLPKSYSRVIELTEASLANIADVENKILGVDHSIAGKRLGQKWNLPESVIETIWLHHSWINALPEVLTNPEIVQSVHLADIIAREQRIGYSGNHPIVDSSMEVAVQLGCNAEDIEKITKQLLEDIGERAVMLGLENIETENLYHEALASANSELGKLNTKLSQQNQNLKIRSSYFELLADLSLTLKPTQSVLDICESVSRLWAKHQGVKRASVFLHHKDYDIIEGFALWESRDEGPTAYMLDSNEVPEDIIQFEQLNQADRRKFRILPAGTTMPWFFEKVCPVFDMSRTVAIPLIINDKVVGGILWQTDLGSDSYANQLRELSALASTTALALLQAASQNRLVMMCEQLNHSNRLLHDTQKELISSKKLAAVGELAAGAAHEINNPLSIIVGRSEWLVASESDPEKKETLQKISEKGKIITDIITELMEFAKPATATLEHTSASEIAEQAIGSFRNISKIENIEIKTKFSSDLPDISADKIQIVSALVELISNAAQSYDGEDGEIVISTSFDELEEKVIISISDQGCGMDAKTLEKATTPFFSAKKAGRRRGLGLSKSIRNIENNGGTLHLTSKTDNGTIAKIYFPPDYEAANIGE